MSYIPCAICDNPANEFCMVEIPAAGIGNLAVYFCEEDFKRLTPTFIEFGYLSYKTGTQDSTRSTDGEPPAFE